VTGNIFGTAKEGKRCSGVLGWKLDRSFIARYNLTKNKDIKAYFSSILSECEVA
jgi:hypothetical protein